MAPALTGTLLCFLCGRALGSRVEWHHPVPKSRGGRERVPIHTICHRTIHATFSNRDLERDFAEPYPDIARFIEWVRDKDQDFHAPTHRRP